MNIKSIQKAYTLENLIESLDEKGLLILNVLIGQKAIALLSDLKTKEVKPKGILTPDA